MPTPAEFFQKKGEDLAANPSALSGIEATYQFVLTGEGGGEWLMELGTERRSVREGHADSPQCTLTMDAGEFMSMVAGQLNPMMAFMTGKLKVAGEMGLALKLQAILA